MTVDSTGFDSYQEVIRKWIERDRGKVSTEILERLSKEIAEYIDNEGVGH